MSMSEYLPAGGEPSDRAARLGKLRADRLRIVQDFGRYAATIDSRAVRHSSLSLPSRADGRIVVVAHLSHASGAAEGAEAAELLITTKGPDERMDEPLLLAELTAQLQLLEAAQQPDESVRHGLLGIGTAAPTAVTVAVDGTPTWGWFLSHGNFHGIVLPMTHGAIAWVGTRTSPLPTGIFTADLGDHMLTL
jgi:hypothetical protein